MLFWLAKLRFNIYWLNFKDSDSSDFEGVITIPAAKRVKLMSESKNKQDDKDVDEHADEQDAEEEYEECSESDSDNTEASDSESDILIY